MITVESSHIQLSLSCSKCGHGWDIKDHDTRSIHMAEIYARKIVVCPNCGVMNE
jgi:ribosomal protein S27AE